MVKEAREIIALIRGAIAYPNKACGTALMDETLHDWQARAVSTALASAGIRILGPDEVDQVTLERAAAVAECHSDERSRHYSMDWSDGYIDGCRGAAAAIRAIGRKA